MKSLKSSLIRLLSSLGVSIKVGISGGDNIFPRMSSEKSVLDHYYSIYIEIFPLLLFNIH